MKPIKINSQSIFRDLRKTFGGVPAIRILGKQYIRWQRHNRFLRFRHQYGEALRYRLSSQSPEKIALVAHSGWSPDGAGLGLIKALEMAGFATVVLLKRDLNHFLDYYRLACVKKVIYWEDFTDTPSPEAAEELLEKSQTIQNLLKYEYHGARVGRFAVSTSLRELRSGSLDLQSPRDRGNLLKNLAEGMIFVTAAERIVQTVQPEKAIIVDPIYSPLGELFDICLAKNIEVITADPARKINSAMLKRYTLKNREEHPVSLSQDTWRLVRNMAWTESRRESLREAIYNAYDAGDWFNVGYGRPSNQFDADTEKIQKRLGLDRTKKNAFIFPHITWDASMSWGKSLFENYQDWFIKAVRAACENDKVNWVIRIHPDHIGKGAWEGFSGDPAEVVALREQIGKLPPHVYFVPANSDISTYSLFGLMDYCLTVRGTVGIEAASQGIPVLTAGTGRYDRMGFTIDFDSGEEYLSKLACIQEIPALSPAQRELAERFAYGLFVLRPLPLETVRIKYHQGRILEGGFNKTQINISKMEDWYSAADIKAFSQWAAVSSQTDFLMTLPE